MRPRSRGRRARESGDQLRRYRAFIDAEAAVLSRELVVIARGALPTGVALATIRSRAGGGRQAARAGE